MSGVSYLREDLDTSVTTLLNGLGDPDSLKKLHFRMGLEGHFFGAAVGDATQMDLRGFRPDIVVCEAMHTALLYEPQAAIEAHLATQLDPHHTLFFTHPNSSIRSDSR